MIAVYINDANLDYEYAVKRFQDAADWAKQQCHSFIDFEIQDVSDVSLTMDQVAEYRFKDPKDAMWFELKWKSS